MIFFDLEIEKSEVEERQVSPKYLTGQIEFKDVTFRYGMRNKVLNNISFSIHSGDQVAFVVSKDQLKRDLYLFP